MDEKEKSFLELIDGTVIRTIEHWPGELFLMHGHKCLMSYQEQKDEILVDYDSAEILTRELIFKHLGWKASHLTVVFWDLIFDISQSPQLI